MQDIQEERDVFGAMLETTFKVYGKPEPDVPLKRAYFEALLRYSLEEIRVGLSRHMTDPDQGQFLPKPADIIRNIDGNTATRAESAWTKVDAAIRRIGGDQTVCFDDPIIHAVVTDMGGWVLLTGVNNEEYPFKHNEFVKRYRGYMNRGQVSAVRKLVGRIESHNDAKGFTNHIPKPVLVGNAARAQQLLENGLKQPPQLFHTASALVDGAMQKLTGDKSEI